MELETYVIRIRPVVMIVAQISVLLVVHCLSMVVSSPPCVCGVACVVMRWYLCCRSLCSAMMSCGCACVSCSRVVSCVVISLRSVECLCFPSVGLLMNCLPKPARVFHVSSDSLLGGGFV